MMEIIREVHGIPAWLMSEYLQELGGREDGEGRISGDGWRAAFDRIEDFQLGSIRIGRIRLVIEGNEEIIEELLPKLELKLLRGGG